MEEITIALKDSTVFGMSAGDSNDPLVLGIHGWSQRNGWLTWEPLLVPLADAGFFAVSVDMPGWGKSPALGDGLLTGQKAVAVVIEMITVLGKSTAALMGKSWGGGIAINTALQHPGYVTHLILTAPALRNYDKLKSLEQPVLLAWAEDDTVIPINNAQRFAASARYVQLVTYPSGGHSAAPKNAADFSQKAIDFLRAG